MLQNTQDFSFPESGEVPDFFSDIIRDGIYSPDPGDGIPPAAVSELDTLETSDDVPPASGYRAFLISGMIKTVTKADRLYQQLDAIEKKHRVFNFRTCRTQAAFLRHKETGQIKVGSNSCKLRWCPLCARTKRLILQKSVSGWLKEKKKPKFITLTLAHSTDPLKDQIDRLYNAFKRLRTKPIWKKKIRGGIWFFQLKKSDTDQLWHPHLHIVSHGDYIDKFELACIWKGITHDSKIVDVKKINSVKNAANYVARYAATPVSIDDLDSEDLLLVAQSFKGRRICGTFGSAKGLQLSIMPPDDKGDWEHIGGWNEIFESKDFDDYAAQVWLAYKTGKPCNVIRNYSGADGPPIDIEQKIKEKTEQLLLFGNY